MQSRIDVEGPIDVSGESLKVPEGPSPGGDEQLTGLDE